MTKILHRDPDRRCKGLEEWPEPDRLLWQAALVPGDFLEDGGSRARHGEYANRNAVHSYGRWLAWLDRQGLLEARSSPADRITPTELAPTSPISIKIQQHVDIAPQGERASRGGAGDGPVPQLAVAQPNPLADLGMSLAWRGPNVRGWFPRWNCSSLAPA